MFRVFWELNELQSGSNVRSIDNVKLISLHELNKSCFEYLTFYFTLGIRILSNIGTATHHDDGHEVKGDLAIFLDADLSVLGSSASRYAEYAESIRMEYANVPWSAFQSGRIAVLKRFLDVRPSLYFTDRARELMEASARSNIQGEIQRLRSGLVVADSKI